MVPFKCHGFHFLNAHVLPMLQVHAIMIVFSLAGAHIARKNIIEANYDHELNYKKNNIYHIKLNYS